MKEKELPRISDAEWIVMEAIWESGKMTTGQVVKTLSSHCDWKPKTVQTLLRRLVEKGALASTKQGRGFLFEPLVSALECRQSVGQTFLDRVFQGRLSSMVSCFIERGDYSEADIEQLKRILEGDKP